MNRITGINLKSQYLEIEDEIKTAIESVIQASDFINGSKVSSFEHALEEYLSIKHAIGCASGTDALQVALMALDLNDGDEVIVPSFTYAAAIEVILLLRLTPVLVDVSLDTFTINCDEIVKAITTKTKVIMPVHLYGLACDMDSIMKIAEEHNLTVIEDNAQAIGTDVIYKGSKRKTGTIGNVGCTSFFPTKNLGCYGDGGAITTNNTILADKIRMICNHGQTKKYYHQMVGVNSRLDTLQAAILEVKLKHLERWQSKKTDLAERYNEKLNSIPQIQIPQNVNYSSHVYHQYTLRVLDGRRDELKTYLDNQNISSTIYYPVPAHQQEAYKKLVKAGEMSCSEQLASEVLSIPIHAELKFKDQDTIIDSIIHFYG